MNITTIEWVDNEAHVTLTTHLSIDDLHRSSDALELAALLMRATPESERHAKLVRALSKSPDASKLLAHAMLGFYDSTALRFIASDAVGAVEEICDQFLKLRLNLPVTICARFLRPLDRPASYCHTIVHIEGHYFEPGLSLRMMQRIQDAAQEKASEAAA